jgi:hypothetical protein
VRRLPMSPGPSTSRDRLSSAVVGLLVGAASFVTVGGCGSGDDSTVAVPTADGGGASASDARSEEGSADAPGEAHTGAADATLSNAGDGSSGKAAHASFPAGPIDLGPVGCGGAPAAKNLSVTNTGGSTLTVSASEVGTAFSVTPSSLTLAPGASGSLAVMAAAPASAAAGTPLTGSLAMFTNDPANTNVSILLSTTPTGATLSGANQYTFASSEVGVAAPPLALQLTNVGNAAATFTVGIPSDPSVTIAGIDGGAGFSLSPGDTWTATATFTPIAPSSGTAITATSVITASGTICGATISSLGFTGRTAAGNVAGWPSTDSVDFGPAPCGGAAPEPRTITLTNTGTTAVRVTGVDTTGIGGFMTDVVAGAQVAPNGGTLTITLEAPPIPVPSALTPSVSLSPVTGTVTIHTDADPTSQGTSIHLAEEPQGAILAFGSLTTAGCTTSPNFGDFSAPVLLLQTAPAQSFCVVNTGNLGANVTLSATENSTVDAGAAGDVTDATIDATAGGAASSAFSLLQPTFVLPPPENSTIPSVEPESLTFQPVHATATVGSLSMMVDSTTPLCQVLPSPLPLSGHAIGGGPVVTPTSLTFAGSCGGSAPAPQTFVVSNSGTVDLTWTMTALTGLAPTHYTLAADPAPGLLIPGASSTITVTATAVPSPAPNPSPGALAAQVTIDTDVPGDPPHVVMLDEVPVGDQLSVSVEALRFGQIPVTTSIGQTFTLTNGANPGSPDANVTLTVGAGPDAGALPYALTRQPATADLPAGGSTTETVTFDPSIRGPAPATITFTTSDALCSALPAPVALSGSGTAGSVALSKPSLAFGDPGDPDGLVNCGATGTPQTLTLSNVGNQAFDVTSVTLGKGSSSPFSLSGAATATPSVPIGGTTSLTILPAAIPSIADPGDSSAFADAVTITTDAAGDTPHTVPLIMQARGAVIADTPLPTTWNFGTVGAGSIGSFTTSIHNTGNADATVSVGVTLPDVFGLKNNPTTVPGQAVVALVGEFTPPSADGSWTDQGHLTVAATNGFCGAIPAQWTSPTLDLSGASNSNPVVTISGLLVFPTSDCGGAPPGGQSVTIANLTNQPYAYAVTFASGLWYTRADSGPSADSASSTLAANGAATIVVNPKTVIPGPQVRPGSEPYADSLLISVATSPVATNFTVPISWTLNGAVLSLPQGAGPNSDAMGAFYVADTTSGFPLPMANAGTAPVTVDLAVLPLGAFSLQPAVPVPVSPGTVALGELVAGAASPACPTTRDGTAMLTVHSGPVCQPFSLTQVSLRSCSGTFVPGSSPLLADAGP